MNSTGSNIKGYSGPPDGRSHPRFGSILRPLTRALAAGRYRIEVEGKENLPESGAHVFTPTHPSIFDPPVVTAVLNRDVRYMSNIRTMTGVNGKLMMWSGAFPVDREHASAVTIKHCNEVLQSGVPLCIYPEGGIAEEEAQGRVGPLKKGAAASAVAGGAESIVPIALHYAPDTEARPVETAVGILAAAGVTLGTALAATGGPVTRILAGAFTGAVTGGYLYGKRLWDQNPPTKAYNQAPQYMAMLKGAAIGGLAGGLFGGTLAAVAPGAEYLLAGAGGVSTLQVARAWRDREVAHVLVAEPLKVKDYVDRAGGDEKQAVHDLTVDLHRSLGRAKEKLTGVPYDDAAPKFRGKIIETVSENGGGLGAL